jgi:HSP20 family protein
MAEKTTTQKSRVLRPRAVVDKTKDGKIKVILEMPGVGKENLNVKIENNELAISGGRDSPAQGKYIFRERSNGDYHAVYTLDETVDAAKVGAVLEKGILTLTLELKEHVKPRSIPVRVE